MIRIRTDASHPEPPEEVIAQALGNPNVDPRLREEAIRRFLEGHLEGGFLAHLARNPSLKEFEVKALLELPLPREERVEVLLGLVENPGVAAHKDGLYTTEAYVSLLGLYDVYGHHLRTPRGAFMPDSTLQRLTEAILSNEGFPPSALRHFAEVLEKRALLREKNLEIAGTYAQDPAYGPNYQGLRSETEASLALTLEAMRALADHPGLDPERASRLRRAADEIQERRGAVPSAQREGVDL